VNPARGRLLRQLNVPDPVGRDLALLRTRLYRFSNDLRWYVLAEALEENYIAGQYPQPRTITAVRSCLDMIRHKGNPATFSNDIAADEGINIGAALKERDAYHWHGVSSADRPRKVIVILGAPRSGTSHLFNLIAARGTFAYFTTASCWAWPVRNLHQPGRRLFTDITSETLAVDNKRTRIIPSLVMPGEAEDIWHRAMPVYRHIHGHRYDLSPQHEDGDPRILHAAASAHMTYFHSDTLLVKSPFCSFRIPQLERQWGTTAYYIHIIRDRRETAESMHRNHFEFAQGNRLLDGSTAWSLFTNAVKDDAPVDRLVTIRHEELLRDPEHLNGVLVAL
jgi:hypothetical protein